MPNCCQAENHEKECDFSTQDVEIINKFMDLCKIDPRPDEYYEIKRLIESV